MQLVLNFISNRKRNIEISSNATLPEIEETCNEYKEKYGNFLRTIELVLDSKTESDKIDDSFIESCLGKNPKEEVLASLGGHLNEPRVQEEIACLSFLNYAEIYVAQKISFYLKCYGFYYVICTDVNNLYICYLLGITEVNPLDENNPLPYELAFLHSSKSLSFEFRVPPKAISQVRRYISDLSNGYAVNEVARKDDGSFKTLEHSQLIPLKDNLNLKKGRCELNDNDYIRISTLPLDFLNDLSHFIQKHGIPQLTLENNKYIIEDFFSNNIKGISSLKGSGIGKYLGKCSKDVESFSTIAWIISGIHGTNVIEQVKVDKITQDIIKKFPASREQLYYLVQQLGLEKEKALKLIEFMKSIKYRYNHFEEWNSIINSLPEYLQKYLNHIDYIFPLSYGLAFSKAAFWEGYYKYNAKEFYDVKYKDILSEI